MQSNNFLCDSRNSKKLLIITFILILFTVTKAHATTLDLGNCPKDLKDNRSDQYDTYVCTCDGPPHAGTVWGTNVYTDDSVICQAAVHAGKMSWAGTKKLTLYKLPGLSYYYGSHSVPVISYDYGSWPGSYTFDKVEESHFDEHLSYIQNNAQSGSVTFFAGGDPQFGYYPSTTNKEPKYHNLPWQEFYRFTDSTMHHVSALADNCYRNGYACAPAFTIAGDLLMNRHPLKDYHAGVVAQYTATTNHINSNTQTVVLDGTGNHDRSKIGSTVFFDQGSLNAKPTGQSSRFSAWNVVHSELGRSCWENGGQPDDHYCAYEDLQYYTVGIKARDPHLPVTINNAQAYIVQLHAGGFSTNDSNALAYLDKLIASYGQPGGLDKNVPIFIVAHWLSNDAYLTSRTNQLNVAGVILGHFHHDIVEKNLTNQGSVPNHHTAGNWKAPVLNASALLFNTFLAIKVDNRNVTVTALDRTKSINAANGNKTYHYQYRP